MARRTPYDPIAVAALACAPARRDTTPFMRSTRRYPRRSRTAGAARIAVARHRALATRPSLACSPAAGAAAVPHIRSNVKPAFVGAVTPDGLRRRRATTCSPRGSARRVSAPPLRRRPPIPTAPTAAELRRLAIFNNYRAILDISPKGGYGTLYGPNIDADGNDTLGEGKIAGTEYLAYADDGSGKQERDDDGPGAGVVRSRPAVHRHRGVVRLARRLRRDRQRRRVGLEARLRGRLHRQGHRHAASTISPPIPSTCRTARARDAAAAGTSVQFHGGARRRRSRGVQRRVPEPDRDQARAFAAESGEGLGQRHARRRPLRVLRAERAVRGEDRRRHARRSSFKADNTIVIASSVSNGGARRDRRGRAGHRGPDRRRRRRRAGPRADAQPEPHRDAGAANTIAGGGEAALRLLHVRQPLPALRDAVDAGHRLARACRAPRRAARVRRIAARR